MSLFVANSKKIKRVAEFGDFQTPLSFATDVALLLRRLGMEFSSLIEPNCGRGNFIIAGSKIFPQLKNIIGLEINPVYVNDLKDKIVKNNLLEKTRIINADFFDADWKSMLSKIDEPILIIGNPPWITNAGIGSIGGSNLPQKSNFMEFSGLDAITGKSNFDISEWMMIKLVEALEQFDGVLAMLCKTIVARKVLYYIGRKKLHIESSSIYLIDAKKLFNASVDACLFICKTGSRRNYICKVMPSIYKDRAINNIGYVNNILVADVDKYHKIKHLIHNGSIPWRSGIKHDCSKVMELIKVDGKYRNGLKELMELEEHFIFPLLKSSDLANNRIDGTKRRMLVTQRYIGEGTAIIKNIAPKTWNYLTSHSELLEKRSSHIYKQKPLFSIFGVGPYSFTPWKIAISGLYKKLSFIKVGPQYGKPVVLDDTCYFIPCSTERNADFLITVLNSNEAKDFFNSLIFWDNKRPINKSILQLLDIFSLAKDMGIYNYDWIFMEDNP